MSHRLCIGHLEADERETPMGISSGSPWFVGGPVALVGLAIAVWSWLLWRRPNSLRPDSPVYRYFYLDWQMIPWRRKNSGRLTDRQIKYYALRGIGGGVLLILAGIAIIVNRS